MRDTLVVTIEAIAPPKAAGKRTIVGDVRAVGGLSLLSKKPTT
ncbi:hypothetical protein EBBID32_38730 [Sphingobium indicum BiD32]|uniref:Uncharacterized protein n=1 Tax=Sphingobium indicum BiD32 TaxID=1301087 RepID=N1MRC2_9SPHN|nr:hypothetical protein EBBID32_38730 [Sphingobium indicum BiD32]